MHQQIRDLGPELQCYTEYITAQEFFTLKSSKLTDSQVCAKELFYKKTPPFIDGKLIEITTDLYIPTTHFFKQSGTPSPNYLITEPWEVRAYLMHSTKKPWLKVIDYEDFNGYIPMLGQFPLSTKPLGIETFIPQSDKALQDIKIIAEHYYKKIKEKHQEDLLLLN